MSFHILLHPQLKSVLLMFVGTDETTVAEADMKSVAEETQTLQLRLAELSDDIRRQVISAPPFDLTRRRCRNATSGAPRAGDIELHAQWQRCPTL